MDDSWYDDLDGLGLAAAIRAGDVTAAEAVDAAIRRIEADDPALNAVVATRFDDARAEAGATSLPDGPFTGVPYAVNVSHAVDARLAALGRALADDDIEPFTHLLYERGRCMTGVEVVESLHEIERAGRSVAPYLRELRPAAHTHDADHGPGVGVGRHDPARDHGARVGLQRVHRHLQHRGPTGDERPRRARRRRAAGGRPVRGAPGRGGPPAPPRRVARRRDAVADGAGCAGGTTADLR